MIDSLTTPGGYVLEDAPHVPCLCIRYEPGMGSAQFREAQLLLLDLIRKRGVQKLFIDTSRMRLLSPAERVWVVTDWFTQAAKAGLQAIAGLAPADFVGKLIMVEPLVKIGSSFAIQVRWFPTRQEALWWLEGYQVPKSAE
jgi:hypothetical protein